jgi:hypothetical protein
MDDQPHTEDSRSSKAPAEQLLEASADGTLHAVEAGAPQELSPFAARNLAAAEARRQRKAAARLRQEARRPAARDRVSRHLPSEEGTALSRDDSPVSGEAMEAEKTR